MSDVLNFIFGLVLLIFGAYVVIFGGIGALLARHRGGSLVVGFIVGLVPLIGWLAVMLLTRSSTRRVTGDEWLEDQPTLDTPGRGGGRGHRGSQLPRPPDADPHDY